METTIMGYGGKDFATPPLLSGSYNTGAEIITNIMIPYSLYNYGVWYIEWTSTDIGSYLGPCMLTSSAHSPGCVSFAQPQ